MRGRTPWLVFAAALTLVVAVMGWVTLKLVDLEKQRVETEQQAALEEQVRIALWRLDTATTPLISQEIAQGGLLEDMPASLMPRLPDPPAGVHARFIANEDGPVVLLNSVDNEPEQVAQLGKLLSPETLKDQLDNPVQPAVDEAEVYRQVNEIAQGQGKRGFYSPQNQKIRSTAEWSKRSKSVQDNVNRYANSLTSKNGLPDLKWTSVSGATLPLWIDQELVLARIVREGDKLEIHGSWLDWPTLRTQLLAEIEDLFPNADLVPAADGGDPERMLATLPVRLVVGTSDFTEVSGWSPMRASLAVIWVAVLIAIASVFALLRWSLALSERRASFVSAVTHELRTPLTTFQMYTEMLSEGMVSEARQRKYLATLRREADRLGTLVENVLSYARIESDRVAIAPERLTVHEVFDRAHDRLEERGRSAGMGIVLELDDEVSKIAVRADPTAADQILFNLVDNAAKYAPSEDDPRIVLTAIAGERAVEFVVRDFGPGIPPDEARRIFEPFAKGDAHQAGTKPGVGLGLALCRRLAREMGGDLRVEPADPGARFVLVLPRA